MASFTAERRTKEIGVRKVMGASEFQIVKLLSMESAKLVLIAFVIAAPLAYFSIGKWLQTFTYSTSLEVISFIVAGAIVMIVALLTVGLHSIKSATTNPVESLHYE
jgi:putative ABC transport system permease protein